jgi:hypothetical protein
VVSSCEFGTEPSGSIKCWVSSVQTTSYISSSAQLHVVSWIRSKWLAQDVAELGMHFSLSLHMRAQTRVRERQREYTASFKAMKVKVKKN